MISGTRLAISAGIVAQLLILVRVLAQRVKASGHRVARRVVAADDQQGEIAHEFAQRHVLRRPAMREHRL